MKPISVEHLPLYRRLGMAIAAVDGIRTNNQAALDNLVTVASQAYLILEWLDEVAAGKGKFAELARIKLELVAPTKPAVRRKYSRDN
jgi:hypothetical protein